MVQELYHVDHFSRSLSSGGIMNSDTLAKTSEAGSCLDVVAGSFVTSLMSPCSTLGVILVDQPLLGELATVPCFHHLWSRALTVVRWSPKASTLRMF